MDITAIQRQPQMPQSEEPTKDQPIGSKPTDAQGQQTQQSNQQDSPEDQRQQQLLDKYGKKLLELIKRTEASWEWKRRGIVLKSLKSKEFLKGNQSVGFYPGTYDTFDALEEYHNFTGPNSGDKNGDETMDRRPHNFYQMVENAFEAALSAQVPKNRWMPANADEIEDRETSKVASRIETIIERANKIKGMLRLELMELFTGGAYFKFTRYVVDSDRTGTHKETVLQMAASDVLPARYVCFQCGTSTNEDELVAQKSLQCPNCGAPLGEENYFPSHIEQIPLGQQKEDVPNGMVLQDVYSVLQVNADPDADGLRNTRLLDLKVEVPVGWLRITFPKMWDTIQPGDNSGSGTDQMERQYRDMLTTPAGSAAWMNSSSQTKPTYARAWCQPELLAELDDRKDAEELLQEFPKGLMIASVGETPLQIRPAKLTDEWTWCGSKKGFGLYPTPVGDPAIPIQERINDHENKIDEYMDRLACGILLANQRYIDTKAMNGKRMLPGLLNPVAFSRNAPVSNIQDLIFQVKAEMDTAIFTHLASLKQDMELLVGTPPQLFGAGTQTDVDTMGGQQMQRDQGMVKLGIIWDLVREEHAESGENAVNCAARNMTDDWIDVVADETDEFRNEYVHVDQMKGSVHAEPETDQGFPMTWSEIRDFYLNVMQQGGEMLDYLASEPENVDNMLRYMSIPGLIAPGANKRDRLLIILNALSLGQPTPAPDPITGQPIMLPSVLPIKEFDGNTATENMVINWSEKHWDKLRDNPAALQNILAFYRMCVQFEREQAAEQAMAGGGQPGLPPGPPQGNQPALPA